MDINLHNIDKTSAVETNLKILLIIASLSFLTLHELENTEYYSKN